MCYKSDLNDKYRNIFPHELKPVRGKRVLIGRNNKKIKEI